MRILVQRVHHAKCVVNDKITGEIQKGFVLFVGISKEDDISKAQVMANKIAHARLFEDENEKLNLNIQQINGEILSISQFTLYADTKKGHRPSFDKAANAAIANEIYLAFNKHLREYCKVEEGIFQAHMNIEVNNDGPVSILYEN